jgi:predicted transcriptional regulator
MSYMDKSLSVRLTPGLRRDLERLAKRQNRRASDLARDALRQYVAVEEFRSLRARTLPFAEAQGILTDDDVFKSVS